MSVGLLNETPTETDTQQTLGQTEVNAQLTIKSLQQGINNLP